MLEIVGKERSFGKVKWPATKTNFYIYGQRNTAAFFLGALVYLAGRLMKNWKPSDNKASKMERYTKKESISRPVYLPAPYLKQTTSQQISIPYNAPVPTHSEIPWQCLFTLFL